MKDTWAAGGLYFLLMGPWLVSAEVLSVLSLAVLVAAVVANGLSVPRGWAPLVGPLAAVLLIGLAGALGQLSWAVLRDTWYLSKSILFLLTAYVLSWFIQDLRSTLRVFVVVGLATASAHLTYFVYNPEILNESIGMIRGEAGRGFLVTVIALAVLAGGRRAGVDPLDGSVWLARVTTGLCTLSVALSFSRTFLAATAIMLGVSLGGLHLLHLEHYTVAGTRRLFARSIGVVLILFLGYQIAAHTETGATLVDKIGRSIEEVTAQNYEARPEMAQHWRGYETHRAWVHYREGRPLHYLFGRGYGSYIDTGMPMKLGERMMRFVPVIHNGYAYLLFKTGALGLLLYVAFLVRVVVAGFRAARGTRPELVVTGELLVGAGLTLAAMTLVVSGLMNKESLNAACFLIGALWAFRHREAWFAEVLLADHGR